MSLQARTKQVQQQLVRLGFNPGPVDGEWGPRTASAVLALANAHAILGSATGPQQLAGLDSRTQRNLRTLQPGALRVLLPFVREAIAHAGTQYGVTAKVICGLRDKAGQDKAVADGASKAGYGYSWHNYGMAVDFGLFKGTTYLDAAQPRLAQQIYKKLGVIAKRHGIEWGGTWRNFPDAPHFHVDVGNSTPTAMHRKKLHSGNWSYV